MLIGSVFHKLIEDEQNRRTKSQSKILGKISRSFTRTVSSTWQEMRF